MERKPMLLFIIISIFVMFLVTGCNGGNLKDVNINIGLMNTSKEPYNISLGHDSEVTPESLIEPAGMRFWTATVKAQLDSSNEDIGIIKDQVKVSVGQNGQKIKTEVIDLNCPYKKGMSVYLKWNGSAFEVSY